MADEALGLWYVLLVNKARLGDHWLLKRLSNVEVYEVVEYRRGSWEGPPSPVKTRSYKAAVSFDDRNGVMGFIKLCGYMPPGYLAVPCQILPPRVRRKPAKRTPYGPVTLLEGQGCLFAEAQQPGEVPVGHDD